VWALREAPGPNEAALESEVELDPGLDWLVRCDRVDFPPGGMAYRHVHPGPGIRRLLFGELTIESPEETHTYRAGEAWFEGADFPVLATASATEDTAFVRVLLLPSDWAGERTIRYVDPADDAKPRLQRATVLLEEPLAR
jgi:quercetin dioxygenase-like cupin family protein